ncbi:MAG: hypothetical protein P4M02_09015 [Clostridia bacterium]|nr:hypothetical protein [Clostridia bacterium]
MQNKLAEKSLKSLEYDKILEMLAGKCSCEDSSQLAMSLEPLGSAVEVSAVLGQTSDACRLSLRFGGPSFFGLKNTASALHRAKIGSSLTMRELIDIASDLGVLRSLARYREASQIVSSCLDELFDSLSPNKYLEDKIT